MTQTDFGTIDPNTKSGTQLATDLNDWRNTVHSSHLGSSAPSYIVGGMMWADSTTANYIFNAYDGTDSIPVWQLDATSNVARVAIDADGDSYIAAPTDDEIDVVLAGTVYATFTASGLKFDQDSPLLDANGNELLAFSKAASAVNEVTIANAATSGAPSITATGGDANVGLVVGSKGTGSISFQIGASQVALMEDDLFRVQNSSGSGNTTLYLRADGSATADARLVFEDSAGNDDFEILFDQSAASLTFRNGAGTKFLRLDGAGAVALGSNSGDALTALTNDVVQTYRPTSTAGNNCLIVTSDVGGANTTNFIVAADGDVTNTNNSYGAISDARLKENIEDAGSQWDDIAALRLRNFNFIGREERHIGFIAQEVEETSPGAVKDGEDGMKRVKTSVLLVKAVGALQEAMARLEAAEAEIAALKKSR